MKCYNHPDRDAVGTCVDCGKGLCQECMYLWTIPVCADCNLKRWQATKHEVFKEFAITAVFAIIGLVFAFQGYNGLFNAIAVIWMMAGVYPGWKMLTRITPNVFLILPLIGWVLYFFIKFFIAMLIGWICLPIRLFKNIRTLEEAKKIEMAIASLK